MLNTILENMTTSSISICLITSIILGLIIAFIHLKTTKYNKNFIITLSILPLIVSSIIMLVNGNLGTSVAVLGAFSLIKFRSIPGNSREITSIFIAMAIGLAIGMGCIVFAICLTIIISILLLILSNISFGENKNERMLRILIPENLDYTTVFDEIFEKYLTKVDLDKVKTTNMGSIFELTYNVVLKNDDDEKKLIDDIRCLNGNLKILLARPISNALDL